MMNYTKTVASPVGELILFSDGKALTGLYFNRAEFEKEEEKSAVIEPELPLFHQVETWLTNYFNGENLTIDFELAPQGTTFQKLVWSELRQIPYGKTTTYGEISQVVGKALGKEKMSAQAVGGAIGRNPLSIVIPCHRVIGKNGSVTGYGGGIERKLKLFELEKVARESYFVPKNIKESRMFVNYK